MADRIRLTSVIGDTRRANAPAGRPLPTPGTGPGIVALRAPSNLVTRRARYATEEAIDECTSRLAPSPHLLRHAARHRAIGGHLGGRGAAGGSCGAGGWLPPTGRRPGRVRF